MGKHKNSSNILSASDIAITTNLLSVSENLWQSVVDGSVFISLVVLAGGGGTAIDYRWRHISHSLSVNKQVIDICIAVTVL